MDKRMELVNIVWLDPWTPIDQPKVREAMQSELYSELSSSHPLFGLSAFAVARRYDQDDVLFKLADGRVAEVHLTWSRKPEPDPHWPQATIFASAAIWAEERMRPLQLSSLIHFDALLADIEAGLAALGWGSEPVVTLTREHVADVLRRFASGEITAATVEAWANLVEGRDDVQFEPGHEHVLVDAVHDLANPVLQGKLENIAPVVLAKLC